MNYFLNNRDLIKNLAINTGTTGSETFTTLCTTTEVTLGTDFEQQDFYVFCDAIQRSVLTGVALSMDCTVKLDINNTAIQYIINQIKTLLTTGEIAQFNNQTIQFELCTGVDEGVLTYTKIKAPVVLNFSELGGAAEDASEFGLNIVFNGTGEIVTG